MSVGPGAFSSAPNRPVPGRGSGRVDSLVRALYYNVSNARRSDTGARIGRIKVEEFCWTGKKKLKTCIRYLNSGGFVPQTSLLISCSTRRHPEYLTLHEFNFKTVLVEASRGFLLWYRVAVCPRLTGNVPDLSSIASRCTDRVFVTTICLGIKLNLTRCLQFDNILTV